ncbi:MAG: BREX system P-loop protein BrxC [Fusobacteriaceae bacterium]
MFTIKDFLRKDITRNINGVVKAEKSDEKVNQNELEEYVVTKEVREQMDKIFTRYVNSLNNPTEDMGIWISGFFGSGKSHLLKMIGNILDSKEFAGKRAAEYFDEKVGDNPMLLANIKKAANEDTDVILFNIDNVSDQQTSQGKDAIVTAFLKKFNEMQGFSRDMLKVAEFERNIWKKGKFEDFKERYKKESGNVWEEDRRNLSFSQDYFLDVIDNMKLEGFSVEAAERWLEDINTPDAFPTPENFVELLEEYLDMKGSKHRIIFLVDEIGQYIGDDSKLMLNLQSVVEKLGTALKGRVWVGVTSQQNMEAILGEADTKRNDFSKIQGRFKTMISLSSSHVDEVIKKRLLEKTPGAFDTLKAHYIQNKIEIQNTINFHEAPTLKLYENDIDYAETYPFVRYQFNLLQNIFDNIRVTGLSGKHMAKGERSLLNAFQEAGIRMKDKVLGEIVPFYCFYDSIEQFLDGSAKQPIIHAEKDGMEVEALNLLKLLFLLKGMNDRVKTNVDNLASFMVEKIDQDTKTLKENIKKHLRKLEAHNLIQREADQYFFLTNEEQDINKEIKETKISYETITREIGTVIYEDILTVNKIVVKETKNSYGFNQKINEITRSRGLEALSMTILTPESDEYDKEVSILSTRTDSKLMVKLGQNSDYLGEMKQYLQVKEYCQTKGALQDREILRRIISDIQQENSRNRKARIKNFIEEAITEAQVYIDGSKLTLGNKNAEGTLKDALENLAKTIFNKAGLIKKSYDEKSIKDLLTVEMNSTLDFIKDNSVNPNNEAIDDVLAQIKRLDDRCEQITMKKLVDKYSETPFGWKELDVHGLVTELYVYGQIRLEFNGDKINDRNIAKSQLTKTQTNNQEKLIIIPKEDIDPTRKAKTIKLLKEVFGSGITISEDDIVEAIGKNCRVSVGNTENILRNYGVSKFEYPGKSILEDWKDIIQNEILSVKGKANQIIDNFLERGEELADIFDDVDDVKNFFSKNKTKFDDGVNKLASIERNKEYIGEILDLQSVKILTELLENKKPYGKIPEISILIESIDKEIEILIENERVRLIGIVNTQKEICIEKLSDKGFLRIVEDEYEKLIKEIMNTEGVNVFQKNYTISKVDTIIEARIKRMEDEENSQIPVLRDATSTETTAPVKVQERIVKQFKIKPRSNMVTEEEIRSCITEAKKDLDKLERELLDAIKENKKVDVI